MANEEDSPLIQALPPVSDYLTYLTIVEYNLTLENLPILHKVLQDEKLTINIGWDLVHLLVPLLPESEACLQDIARLGNPREVILKVIESLRLIDYGAFGHDADDDADAMRGAADPKVRADSSTYPIKTAPVPSETAKAANSQMVERAPPLPLAVSQFISLLSMLSILHARIKTKFPSRFLSSTLQAILASFANSSNNCEEMVQAIVKTVRALSGVQRPTLPARRSSGMLSSVSTVSGASAPDPEAIAGEQASSEEHNIQIKLLQSFVTHLVEEYMLELNSAADDVPGIAWCSRLREKLQPERSVPETKTMSERFEKEQALVRRIDALGQLVTLAQDLKLSNDALLSAALATQQVDEPTLLTRDEDEPPRSVDDIPLSRIGSLLLYTARQVSGLLYGVSSKAASSAAVDDPFAILPDHLQVLKSCLSSPAQGNGTLGAEPEPLIDAVLALGLICLEQGSVGAPDTDEQFNEYLQITALLASNCPSPNLRGHAHYLTTTVLRSQPDDSVRLAFIRDTLEHCPFENLKVSAVGWIKGETIEANPMVLHDSAAAQNTSVFASPNAIDSLAPYLFPSLEAELVIAPLTEAWRTFQLNISFYLASLNFVYLLLQAKHLHSNLEIADMWKDNDVAGSFMQPLRDGMARFRKALDGDGELVEERTNGVMAELMLLEATIERVTASVTLLNET